MYILADEQLESPVSYRLQNDEPAWITNSPSLSPYSTTSALPAITSTSLTHGLTLPFSDSRPPKPASCLLHSFQPGDLVDCAACLDKAKIILFENSVAPQRSLCDLVLHCVLEAGETGITVSNLIVSGPFSSHLVRTRLTTSSC